MLQQRWKSQKPNPGLSETCTAVSDTHCHKHMQVQHAVLLPTHNSPPQTPAKPIYLGAGQCEGWKRSNLTLQRYSCQIAGFLFLLYFPHLLPAILYQQLSMSTCKTIQRAADYWKLWVKAERCEDSLAAARTLADCTSNGLHNVCQPPLCLLQCNRGGGSVPLQLNKAVGDTAQVGFLEVPLAVGALPPLLHHGARKAVSQRFQLQKPYVNLHPQSSQQLCGPNLPLEHELFFCLAVQGRGTIDARPLHSAVLVAGGSWEEIYFSCNPLHQASLEPHMGALFPHFLGTFSPWALNRLPV